MTEGDREPPGWLRDLAATAAVMEVPQVARPPASGGRRSAVLVLFGDGVHGPDLLYIQRSEGLRRHPGQPAFPGGKIEDERRRPGRRRRCARRWRRPASTRPGVDVLTTLPEMFIARSEFRVVPVLGWWRTPSAVRPTDIGEVAAVERIGVADLADPANRLMIRFPGGHSGPAFRIGPMLIWGFTALLTDRLLALGGFERPWDATTIRALPDGAP